MQVILTVTADHALRRSLLADRKDEVISFCGSFARAVEVVREILFSTIIVDVDLDPELREAGTLLAEVALVCPRAQRIVVGAARATPLLERVQAEGLAQSYRVKPVTLLDVGV